MLPQHYPERIAFNLILQNVSAPQILIAKRLTITWCNLYDQWLLMNSSYLLIRIKTLAKSDISVENWL